MSETKSKAKQWVCNENFRYHSENFTMIAKISYSKNFAMCAKISLCEIAKISLCVQNFRYEIANFF